MCKIDRIGCWHVRSIFWPEMHTLFSLLFYIQLHLETCVISYPCVIQNHLVEGAFWKYLKACMIMYYLLIPVEITLPLFLQIVVLLILFFLISNVNFFPHGINTLPSWFSFVILFKFKMMIIVSQPVEWSLATHWKFCVADLPFWVMMIWRLWIYFPGLWAGCYSFESAQSS